MSLVPPGDGEGGRLRSPSGEILLSKTCQNCFSLKIRCDRTQRNETCDRCARLGKQCVFRPAKRRDNSAKRDSRIQALEQQVQDLLRIQNPSHNDQQLLPDASRSTALRPSFDDDVIDEGIVTIEEAGRLVEVYKSEMVPHFPFIIIPEYETATSLRHKTPFLFLAMLVAASFHDLVVQENLGNRFKVIVSEKVLFGEESATKLEKLQGLLIVLAWNQYHGLSKYHTQYMLLAISIAVDLRLDRRPMHSKPRRYEDKRDPLVRNNLPEVYGPEIHTWGPDQQRAAAGIFYMSSTVSKLLDKMNAFPCTQYIEDGCLALGQRVEHRTDKDLYHVIRLQKIIENIETLASEQGSEAEAEDAYMRVRTQLEEFRAFLSVGGSDSHLLLMQFHTAKLFLFQVAFFERNLQQSPALHINILSEGLEEVKDFLDLFLLLPPKSEMALTQMEWVQLSFCLTQAAKFAIVSQAPEVETQTRNVRLRLNIDHVFRHLTLRIGALVGRAGEGDRQKDIFLNYLQRVRRIQEWYGKMTRAIKARTPDVQDAGAQRPNPRPVTQSSSQSHSHGTPSSYASSASSRHPSPMQVSPHQSSQIPLAATFSHQQLLPGYSGYPQPTSMNMQQPTLTLEYDTSATSVGMVPMDTYSAYGNVPSIAFPDLMSAPGWDTLFTVPMEDMSWMADISQGYGGMNQTSSSSENGWGDPGSL